MSKQDEYRAKAEHCGEMAAKAIGPADKAEWLQLATNWQTLASLSDREHREAAAYQKQWKRWTRYGQGSLHNYQMNQGGTETRASSI